MRTGKLSPEDLRRVVLSRVGRVRNEVLVHAELGEDCSVIDLDGDLLVVSTDPITAAQSASGRLAVVVACNDVAAMGAEPIGLMATVLVPPSVGMSVLDRIAAEMDEAACELGVEIIGGHTEVTASVRDPLICATVVGRAIGGKYVRSSGANVDDAVLVTKSAGMEAAGIIASDLGDVLAESVGIETLTKARGFLSELSVLKEARAAMSTGEVTAMHDATEGGLIAALHELAAASRKRIRIETNRIPVRQETRMIAEAAGIDPLCMMSSGMLVITSPDPERISKAISAAGVDVTRIGVVLSGSEGVFRDTPDGDVEIPWPQRDELYRALETLGAGIT